MPTLCSFFKKTCLFNFKQLNHLNSPRRGFCSIFLWLNKIFNIVDTKRRNLLGTDLTCAEWLLRNGAAVRFRGHDSFITDYNLLMELEETTESGTYHVEEVFAKGAGLSAVGFEHFRGCDHVKNISLINCSYINYSCLDKLKYVKKSLQYLEINSCFSVNDKAVLSLTQLRNLRKLILRNLPGVENQTQCEVDLRNTLINCEIIYEVN